MRAISTLMALLLIVQSNLGTPAGVGAWTRGGRLPIRLRLWTPPHQ